MKISLDRRKDGKDKERGESHHGFAIRLLIFRLKDTIRDSWVLCAEGPSMVVSL